MEGALLRLRPKLMTVSTVVAGLLPIMWSSRVGAEVMKPLATPVLGGMVSSLIHVLIVTPVIFFWIKQRQFGLVDDATFDESDRRLFRWRPVIVCLVVVTTLSIGGWMAWHQLKSRGGSAESAAAGSVVRTIRSGNLDILVRSPSGMLHQGRNAFTIEFRSVRDAALVDVGTVRAGANMVMPGMVMPSGAQVQRSGTPGRYEATAEFGMSGAWRMAIEWNGPAGQGSASFEGAVQ